MAVPDYQTLMLPLLKRIAASDRPIGVMELLPLLAEDLGLNEADLSERLPSGRQSLFHNRVHWAKLYMRRAELLDMPSRGHSSITDRGRALLASNPGRIDNNLLARYPEFVAWRVRASDDDEAPKAQAHLSEPLNATPEERIESARRELEAALKSDLLDRVRQMHPGDFEALIIQLLLKMGYGQGRDEMAQALGGSGDGGVDGVVHQDPLGLDRVYIQAKRYKEGSNIGPYAINSFIGALNIKRANKGLFVTASTFTKQAREHALQSTTHVVLVDGDRLAELMVRHAVGVVIRDTIEIKAVDEGYFEESL